ncbi:TetR/AcrR family transcriptional regulator [Primorskyibacter sp. S187A]|uniref:TetR/AcrR family transcriptional regulator n=1 Tax=Primorskyibacter sp. S187A TaxID=3415130 RepID=UPI003C7AFC1B
MTDAKTHKPAELRKHGYHHGDLRAGLIEATRQLVEEKGPDGFSVTDACKLAGVSTAAPYKHFKDKSEMIAAMVMEGMYRHRTNMTSALDGVPPGTPARIKVLGREYVDFALREPGVFRLKFGGFTDRLDDPRLQEAGEGTFDVVLHEVATCLGQDEITPDVRRRGFMLWSFVHGLSFLMADPKLTKLGGEFVLDELLDDIARRMLAD